MWITFISILITSWIFQSFPSHLQNSSFTVDESCKHGTLNGYSMNAKLQEPEKHKRKEKKEREGKRERGIRERNVEWGWGRDRKWRRSIYKVKPCPVVPHIKLYAIHFKSNIFSAIWLGLWNARQLQIENKRCL